MANRLTGVDSENASKVDRSDEWKGRKNGKLRKCYILSHLDQKLWSRGSRNRIALHAISSHIAYMSLPGISQGMNSRIKPSPT